MQSFFSKGNLTALREISLRQAARRVHTDVELARRLQAATQPWATAEAIVGMRGTKSDDSPCDSDGQAHGRGVGRFLDGGGGKHNCR